MLTKTYSAIDLLNKVLEFIEMTPNSNEWNLRSLKSDFSRQIRFRQIESLLNAFFAEEFKPSFLTKTISMFSNQRKISINSLLNGEFVKDRTVDDYKVLIAFIKSVVKTESDNIDQSKQIKIEQLTFIFPKLIEFKRQIRNLLTFNSAWLEVSSTTSLFSIVLTNSISSNLTGKYDDLDKALALFISPKELIFTEEELIAKFNFPTEDLSSIDADFM